MILRSLNERIEEKKRARAAAGKPPIEITRRTFDPHNYFWRKSAEEQISNSESVTRRRTSSKSSRKSSYTPLKLLFLSNVEDENESSIKATEPVSQQNVATTAAPDPQQNVATTAAPSSQVDKARKSKLQRKTKSSIIKTTGTVLQQNMATTPVSQQNMVTTPVSQQNMETTAAPSQEDEEKKLKLQRKIACKKADTVSMLFTYLQNLSACFASFAHGTNDVCNAISPLASLYEIYVDGNVFQEKEIPLFMLLYGGVGITVGLWILGRRIIQTVGEDITKITAVTGFTVTFCSALSVLLSSNLGLPVSTTQCVAGAIIAVGIINARIAKKEDNATGCMHTEDYRIDWGICRSLLYAWFLTVPVTAAISAAIMCCFKSFIL